MGEWREVELSAIAEVQTGPFGSQLHAADYVPVGVPVIMPNNIGQRLTLNEANMSFITEADATRLSRYKVKEGDIVFSRRGDVDKCILIDKRKADWFCGTGCLFARINSSDADPEFVAYQFDGPELKNWLRTNAVGTTMPNLNSTILSGAPVALPDLPEQRAIASVLSSLDAKIDLLHRQNKTLEAMAETLFRQWFVEEAEEVWVEVGLLDVVKLVPGGTPKTTQANYWDGDIMWISVREISENHKGFINYAYKTITEEGLDNSAANLLPKFGTVISARGTVGKIALLAQPMAYSQSNFGVLPKNSSNYFFTYMLVHNSIEELHSNSYGAVFDTITTQSFQTIRHRLPGTEVINSFEALVRPIFLKMLTNTEQITSLTKLRDTLLPKLMSGEVRVEQSIEQTMGVK